MGLSRVPKRTIVNLSPTKIGNDYYRQTIGIPQGSILSSLLCSFFYGDLERTHLKFTGDLNSVLLRLIDDYLFITTDLAQARKFLRTMHEGKSTTLFII